MIMEQVDSLVADASKVLEGVNAMKSAIQAFGDEQKEAGRAEGYSTGYAQGKNDGYDQGVRDAQAGNGGDPLKIYTLDDLNNYAAEEVSKKEAADKAELEQVKSNLQAIIDAKQVIIDGIESQVMHAKEEALAAFKQELKTKFLETQQAENAAEESFSKMLE